MALNVFVAGATGWAGSQLSKGISKNKNMELIGGLSRKNAGKNLSQLLELETGHIPIYPDMDQALSELKLNVLVEYTNPVVAKNNIIAALKKGVNVVVGTSGLTENDYSEIESVALDNDAAVLAVGNFAITAVLLQKLSEIAARYIPNYEIIDYAHESKVDAPSGTARELAYRLSTVQKPVMPVPLEKVIGYKESRGASLNHVQVHSVRVPGYVIAIESIFGLKDEKLIIKHEAGSSSEPYVKGALLAIEKVGTFKGLKRGLDSVMEF